MSDIHQRKIDHINIVLDKDVEPISSPFNLYKLPYKALPEIDYVDIDTSTELLSKKLSFPFIISSMTGGPDKGETINTNLAMAAESCKVGLGLGSMRVILKDPDSAKTFNVRALCPSIPLFANFGLIQLNYGYGADEINQLIDVIQADGIFLHINALQEVMQPEGDKNFKGLLDKLEAILPKIKAPVIVKEVGTGIDATTMKRLHEIGVKWLDVSGMGGTSWTMVEGHRRKDDFGTLFKMEGYTTVESLNEAKAYKNDMGIIAGGGIRTGLDIAKSIVLGADFATCAKPLLQPALTSSESCIEVLNKLKTELEISMFVTGCTQIEQLKTLQLLPQRG
jgi:isopentenyl-diphosphate Delta-isomerase